MNIGAALLVVYLIAKIMKLSIKTGVDKKVGRTVKKIASIVRRT